MMILALILFLCLIVGVILYINVIHESSLVFDGTGYTTFATGEGYNDTRTGFRCGFKTTQPEGLIMYGKADDGDMFSVKLSDGLIVAEMDTGSGVSTLTSQHHVNDNKWHVIKLKRKGNTASLSIDTETVTATTGQSKGITRPNIIYVGGNNNMVKDVPAFIGAVKNFIFNNRTMDEIEFDFTIGGVVKEN